MNLSSHGKRISDVESGGILPAMLDGMAMIMPCLLSGCIHANQK
jgi:hypothetical protein